MVNSTWLVLRRNPFNPELRCRRPRLAVPRQGRHRHDLYQLIGVTPQVTRSASRTRLRLAPKWLVAYRLATADQRGSRTTDLSRTQPPAAKPDRGDASEHARYRRQH